MITHLGRGALVGRDDESHRVGVAVRTLAGGSGGAIWIDGEPGIGKTALLDAALDEATRTGCQVFRAAADDLGGRFPLRTVLECLEVESRPGDPLREEIGDLLGGAATADPVAAATERLLTLADRLAAEVPLVLAIDDLQWADEASVVFLHRLSRLTRRRPLLLVGACRTGTRRSDLLTLKRGLTGSGATMIALAPLPPESAHGLVAELTGARTVGPGLCELADSAAGNPRYLREIVAALVREDLVVRQGDIAQLTDDGVAAGLPRSLAAAVWDRLGFLTAETMETLRAAALLGPAFFVTDLGAVVGRSALELTAALDEATATGVLVESESRLAFRHPLLRHVLYERTPTGLRLALHLQAARALADAGPAVTQVAEQLRLALHRSGDTPVSDGWVVDWLLGTANTLVRTAPALAVDLLAPVTAGMPTDDTRREPLQIMLATALGLTGRRAEAIREAERVLAATRDPARAARTSRIIARALIDDGRPDAARAVLGRALRAPGLDQAWSARLRATLARAAVADGALGSADTEARRALEKANRSGDPVATAAASHVLGLVQAHRDDLAGAVARVERGLAAAELCDDPESDDLRLLLGQNLLTLLLARERHAEASAPRSGAGHLRTAVGRPTPRVLRGRLVAAEIHYHAGRWDDARAELDAADVARDALPVRDRWWLHGLAALIAVHRDDQRTADTHLTAASALVVPAGEALSGVEYVPVARALLAERHGRPAEAVAVLGGDLEDRGAWPGHRRRLWLPTLVRLALDAGDSAAAAAAARSASAPAAWPGETTAMAASREAAGEHCAGLLGRDPARSATAVDRLRSAGVPLRLAQALEDAAIVLAGHGDLRAARAAHAEASAIYGELTATWELQRADTRLRRHGVYRLGARRRRAASGWDALTPAELTVARLVADGQANPDIAANLVLSRRTVEAHVSHILAKLGVRSRVEIARVAARLMTAPETRPLPVSAG